MTPTEQQRAAAAALTVAALRRSSSHVTPTRTLVLSEQEQPAVRVVSPLVIRPRSNQRTRTGRYESPMDPAAFRRTSVVEGGHEDNNQPRLVAGVDRGTHHRHTVISEVRALVSAVLWLRVLDNKVAHDAYSLSYIRIAVLSFFSA